jgi:hypothetical protein
VRYRSIAIPRGLRGCGLDPTDALARSQQRWIRPGPSTSVDSDLAAELAAASELVATNPSVEMLSVTARLISATSSRWDAGDALLDAVIATEALVGEREGALRLRISLAITLLLEPTDPVAREQVFRAARGAYDQRNRVVHGGHISPDASHTGVIQLSLRAVRELYRSRPERVTDSQRSIRLSLGPGAGAASRNGRGGFRTCDLSRVKRALSH